MEKNLEFVAKILKNQGLNMSVNRQAFGNVYCHFHGFRRKTAMCIEQFYTLMLNDSAKMRNVSKLIHPSHSTFMK
nr:unnamed protein product [Callosobruchus chinensis]